MSVLGQVAAHVAAADPALAAHALADSGPGQLELRVSDPDRAFVLEAVHEGYLMHYGEPRAFSQAMEPDLRLLAGDALYALGLERLAALGDLEAVAELADLISGCARAHIEGDPAAAAALWEVSTAAAARL